MTTAGTLVVLFSISSAVAIAVRRLRIPYTVALVIVGLVLGSVHAVDPPHLTKELLFTVFLPGLLFEAAIHIDSAVFRRTWLAITALAIPGVIAAIAVTAFLLTAALHTFGIVPSFLLESGLVFAAVIAATDPVAVTALFRQLSAPVELSVLVEGESLFNDGTSIVFLTLILAYVAGRSSTPLSLVWSFIAVAGGGAAVGMVMGFVITQMIRRVNDPMIEITLTTIAAYGSFVLAEDIYVSGVIATVVTGMLCGNYARGMMSTASHAAVELFWEYIAFALNSVVFLLIGFEVSLDDLGASWREIGIAYLVVVLTRTIIVFGGRLAWRPLRKKGTSTPPLSWSVVLVWGGLRGALSMVLALAIGLDVPQRDLIVTMTTGVVLLTLLLQGLTMAPLMRVLGLARAAVVPLPTGVPAHVGPAGQVR